MLLCMDTARGDTSLLLWVHVFIESLSRARIGWRKKAAVKPNAYT